MVEKKDLKKISNGFSEIVNGINNGIKEGERIRKFNILDYYLKLNEMFGTTNINLTQCHKRKMMSNEGYYLIKKFVDIQNQAICTRDPNKFLNIKFIYGERVITDEEKIAVLEELKELNIPISDVTFSLGVRRYATSQIQENKTKTRKML